MTKIYIKNNINFTNFLSNTSVMNLIMLHVYIYIYDLKINKYINSYK